MNEWYHTPGQALDPEPLIRLPFRGKPRGINPCFPCTHSGMNKFTPLISFGNKTKLIKLVITTAFAVTTVIAAAMGNETIMPTALILLMLSIISQISENKNSKSVKGSAAQNTIIIYSMTIAVLNILISLFFATIAAYFNWAGLYDGEFVRVTINDIHEFSYGTFLMLLIYTANIIILRFKYKKQNNRKMIIT